jgi:outer membrane protein assembly factor BamB
MDNDGYQDVVVGTPWGDRSIHTISGKTGTILWTHDTHEYGSGGWIYQVDCRYDYNDDAVHDVLAVTGGSATGPRRAYCLDGETGDKIWERPLGNPRGPGFSVIGVEDFTGDGKPDVVCLWNQW